MTRYTPLRDHHNGQVHLSPDVFRLDTHQPIYRRPRHHTWHWYAADVFFRFALPFLVLLICALAWVGLFWIVVAIGRAVRSLSGGI